MFPRIFFGLFKLLKMGVDFIFSSYVQTCNDESVGPYGVWLGGRLEIHISVRLRPSFMSLLVLLSGPDFER